MERHLLTIDLLIAALALYSVGMTTGGSVFFVAGVVCELWFWSRMFRRRLNA